MNTSFQPDMHQLVTLLNSSHTLNYATLLAVHVMRNPSCVHALDVQSSRDQVSRKRG